MPWTLRIVSADAPEETVVLWPENSVKPSIQQPPSLLLPSPTATYPVGRSNHSQASITSSSINLNYDVSISHAHAEIQIHRPTSYPSEKDHQKRGSRPTVVFYDAGSRFGCALLAKPPQHEESHMIQPKIQPVIIEDGMAIRLGKRNLRFLFEWHELLLVHSSLEAKEKVSFAELAARMCVPIEHRWTNSATHLVMPAIQATTKLLAALACGLPIVTPAFLTHWAPGATLTEFLPPLSDVSVSPATDFSPIAERSTLFRGKTFVFFNNSQKGKLSLIISLSGGQVTAVPTTDSQADATDEPPPYLRPDTICVRLTKHMRSKAGPVYQRAEAALKRQGRRLVKETEITRAILAASASVMCNDRITSAAANRFSQAQSQSQSQSQAPTAQPSGWKVPLAKETPLRSARVGPSTLAANAVAVSDTFQTPLPTRSKKGASQPRMARDRLGNNAEGPHAIADTLSANTPDDATPILSRRKKRGTPSKESPPARRDGPSARPSGDDDAAIALVVEDGDGDLDNDERKRKSDAPSLHEEADEHKTGNDSCHVQDSDIVEQPPPHGEKGMQQTPTTSPARRSSCELPTKKAKLQQHQHVEEDGQAEQKKAVSASMGHGAQFACDEGPGGGEMDDDAPAERAELQETDVEATTQRDTETTADLRGSDEMARLQLDSGGPARDSQRRTQLGHGSRRRRGRVPESQDVDHVPNHAMDASKGDETHSDAPEGDGSTVELLKKKREEKLAQMTCEDGWIQTQAVTTASQSISPAGSRGFSNNNDDADDDEADADGNGGDEGRARSHLLTAGKCGIRVRQNITDLTQAVSYASPHGNGAVGTGTVNVKVFRKVQPLHAHDSLVLGMRGEDAIAKELDEMRRQYAEEERIAEAGRTLMHRMLDEVGSVRGRKAGAVSNTQRSRAPARGRGRGRSSQATPLMELLSQQRGHAYGREGPESSNGSTSTHVAHESDDVIDIDAADADRDSACPQSSSQTQSATRAGRRQRPPATATTTEETTATTTTAPAASQLGARRRPRGRRR